MHQTANIERKYKYLRYAYLCGLAEFYVWLI